MLLGALGSGLWRGLSNCSTSFESYVALHRSITAATMVRKYMGKGQNVGLRRQIIAIRVRAACFAKAK